ncbi:AMP-binding protein [Arthrobacter sp. AL08]|uniref:class I adenylate-forming enzyme family protein n=1 Tax=unclassified Arthrobacter TaxID=235627 RepID=UPI001CFFDC63|nr:MULTISPECIES: AMP-binding protein [unclassified Arthrobacter]MCB5282292.1 putative acyl--CoA ligase YhfT [Arthrobacter sp. ES1]MDI3241828.1 AMP-binding protein [Arthrobacter sp. AL05]MDI3277848.1 AMP-binding protein [Arthrobacter sp. AL08]WGZ81091.1 AMP-binding protein [Arthrobacter sp. EM1]
MPFINRLLQWADDRPDGTAVVVAGQRLSWEELREAAAGLVDGSPAVTVLCEENSLHFAAAFTAAVAGERQCAVLDPAWPPHLQDEIRKRIGDAVPAADALVAGSALVDGPAGSPFLIGLTSGTTSVPKAFSRSRRSWRLSFDASVEFFGLEPGDRTLAPGPLAASLNLYALSECLYAGSEFHTLAKFDVGEAHAAVSHDGITRLVLVPTMLRLLSERGLSGGVDAAGIRSIICAGSKLDARTLEAARRWAPNATIFEYYGASELSFVSGAGLLPGQPPEQLGTGIGTAFPGVAIRILDDAGDPLPDRSVGNICVRSGMVSDGYLWGDDGRALQNVNGWHTVGDQGYLEGATLHMLGRRAEMIITAGTNVYPHEVELALASIPGVAAAVAAGPADDLRGQKVVAGIVPSHGGVTATQLKAGVEGVLARSKRPLQYFLLAELPLTDRGKLSRELMLDWIARNDPRVRRLD